MGLLSEATRDTMPDVKVDTSKRAFGFYNQETEGKFDPRHPEQGITLVGDTHLFRSAQKGNADAIKKLASLLVHEKYHADHEPGEGPAYDAQIDTLRQLKASPALIDSVMQAKAVGLKR
jgi:hypothetical protein